MATEVNAAVALKKIGRNQPIAGTMLIGSGPVQQKAITERTTWCDQCDRARTDDNIKACKDIHCKVQHVVAED